MSGQNLRRTNQSSCTCQRNTSPCRRIGNTSDGYITSSNFLVGECKIYNKCPMGKFDAIMKEVLGGEEYKKLMKEDNRGERVPDDILIKRVVDALELKNKALFERTSEPTFMAIDKLNLVDAVGKYQGALRAAEAAVHDAPPDLAEEAAIGGALKFQTGFENEKKKRSKTYVLGYIGTTDMGTDPNTCEKKAN